MNHRRIRMGLCAAAAVTAICLFPAMRMLRPVDADNSAKSIAELFQNHYRRIQTLRATFLESYSEGPRDARIESGTVYFRRPGRMRWEYEAPENKLFLADGKTVWFYVPADHTVTKAPMKESSDWRTPLALLTGKAEISRLCARIDLVTQKGIPAGHVVLRCLPKGEKDEGARGGRLQPEDSTQLPGAEDFVEVLLEVDSSTGQLADVRIRQAGGIELQYRFGGWQEGSPLAEELFQFRPPAGVAIVDGSAINNAAQ